MGVPYREIAARLGYSSASAASRDVGRAQELAQREHVRAVAEREAAAVAERERMLSDPEVRTVLRARRADEAAWLAELLAVVAEQESITAVRGVLVSLVSRRLGALTEQGQAERELAELLAGEDPAAAELLGGLEGGCPGRIAGW